MLSLIPKGRDPHKYVLKSSGDQMVSTPIQLEYAVFILVTLEICSLQFSYPLNVKYKPSVNTKHKFGWLKLTRICMTNAKLYKLTKGKIKEYYKNCDNSK